MVKPSKKKDKKKEESEVESVPKKRKSGSEISARDRHVEAEVSDQKDRGETEAKGAREADEVVPEKGEGNTIVVESSADLWQRIANDKLAAAGGQEQTKNRDEDFETYLEDLFF